MGPRTAYLMLQPGPLPPWASHSCVSMAHSAMCHFQVSSHCWCVPFFCHRVLAGLPLLLSPFATLCHVPLSG
ncbi:unnamed protein product, partial [Staurois parvus]